MDDTLIASAVALFCVFGTEIAEALGLYFDQLNPKALPDCEQWV